MLATLSIAFTQMAQDSTVLPPAAQDQVAQALEDAAEVMSNTRLEEQLADRPAEIQNEIIRINTDARPLALQVALLVPILAGLLGLLNGFRMTGRPDPAPSDGAEMAPRLTRGPPQERLRRPRARTPARLAPRRHCAGRDPDRPRGAGYRQARARDRQHAPDARAGLCVEILAGTACQEQRSCPTFAASLVVETQQRPGAIEFHANENLACRPSVGEAHLLMRDGQQARADPRAQIKANRRIGRFKRKGRAAARSE
jgi:hypothetical protein